MEDIRAESIRELIDRLMSTLPTNHPNYVLLDAMASVDDDEELVIVCENLLKLMDKFGDKT